jgi:hypothetical protein
MDADALGAAMWVQCMLGDWMDLPESGRVDTQTGSLSLADILLLLRD